MSVTADLILQNLLDRKTFSLCSHSGSRLDVAASICTQSRQELDTRVCYFHFPHKGVVDFVDNHVDQTTGTMRIRGVLKNESGKLIPGLFARLTVPGSGRYHAILVPNTAIGNDQSQKNVLVVDKDNKVAVRPVTLGALFGGLRSIVSGINTDDRIIVNGQMHARPGAAVTPIETPIKVNEADFADPGEEIAKVAPATGEQPIDSRSSIYTKHTSSTEIGQ